MTQKSCDVLVIGAGMGGLCAAALLSHAGYQTLVVERLPRIGGRCSTIEYKGFKCAAGAIGPEMGGLLEETFRQVGAGFDVRPAGPPSYLVNGKICEVPSKGGFRALFSAATNDQAEVERVMGAISAALSWMLPSEAISLREWLLQYTQNESILGIFQAMVSATTMLNADELPAREYFLFLKKLRGYRGFGFCPEGSIALPRALAEVIEKHGGAVWTRSPAVKIITDNGMVRGALIDREGQEIEVYASAVISNCGPQKTVELVGSEHIDKGYLKKLEEDVRAVMLIVIQLASDKPLLDHNYLIVSGARRINAIFQPSNVCPEIAPPGKHLFVAGGAPASTSSPLNAKAELDLCFQDLREIIPGFEEHTEVLLTGTFHGQWPAMHAWPGDDMPQKTPIVNLYNVGDGVKSPGMIALPAVAETAHRVVEDIQKRHPVTE